MAAKHAKDILIPLEDYPHIPHWFTVRQAIAEMEKSEIEVDGRKSLPRALLVFDEKYQLLGIIRRRDILRGLEPDFLKTMPVPHRKKLFDIEIDPNLVDLSSGKISKAIQEKANQPVSNLMQPIISTVDYEDHLAIIIYKLVSRDLSLLPVIKDGRIVGVVRSVDVFNEVAKLID